MNTQNHLNEDQILQAIADETTLPVEIRRHLSECRACRREKQGVENGFFRMGNAVRQLAPLPGRRPRLHAHTRRAFFPRPLLAAGISLLLVMAIGWWMMPEKQPLQTALRQTEEGNGWEDEALMSEISRLSENPLPEPYTALTLGTGTDSDENYMEYIVPPLDSQPASRDAGSEAQKSTKKGGLIC